jgi:hypothetical protein
MFLYFKISVCTFFIAYDSICADHNSPCPTTKSEKDSVTCPAAKLKEKEMNHISAKKYLYYQTSYLTEAKSFWRKKN